MARGREKAAVLNAPVEGPWELPEGWRWATLRDVCGPGQYGWTTKAAASGSVKLLRTTDISSGKVDWASVPSCTDAPDEIEKFQLCPGDILISRAGSVGKSFLIEEAPQAVFASYLIRYRPKIHTKLVYYWLQTSYYWQQIGANTAGIAIPNVNASKLNNVLLPIPPLETQRRIVARIDELFSELDDGETALARAREDLEVYRKALLKAAVTGELTADWRAANPCTETGEQLLKRILAERRARWEADSRNKGKRYKEPAAPDTSGLPELPEGWAWMTLGQLGIVSGGLTKNAKRANNELQLPYLRVGNVYAGRFDLERVETIGVTQSDVEKTLLQRGDLLIVEGNGSIDQIGRCAVWDGAVAPCLHQNHLIKVRFSNIFWSYWALAWLSSPHGRKELQIQASSTSGLHTLSISKIDGIKLPLPPTEEIEAILSTINEQLHTSDPEQEIDTFSRSTASLRQSILAAAFKGELVQ